MTTTATAPRLLALLLTCSACVLAQTPAFPGAVVTDKQLFVASDRAQTTLSIGINSAATTLVVADASKFTANQLVTIDDRAGTYEIVVVCSVSTNALLLGNGLTCPASGGRGFAGTSAASHSAGSGVSAFITAYHWNAIRKELEAVESTLGANFSLPYVDVRQYGADPTGATYSTSAIEQASAYACSRGYRLYFPGGTYKYGGAGLRCPNLFFDGDGQSNTIIALDSGIYLIDDNQYWPTFVLQNMQITGGAGAIRNRFSGVNSAVQHIVRNVFFQNYTSAAISTNASDDDFWVVEYNSFAAGSGATSIGVAFSGLVDGTQIINNNFAGNKANIKLQYGNTAYITGNSFVSLDTSTGQRAAIWVVPGATYEPSGNGLKITNNRFGNENLVASDYRILYADEGTGAYFGDRLPSFTASTGWVSGTQVTGSTLLGTSDFENPLVYTFTPNLVGNTWSDIISDGTPFSNIVKCDASILPLNPTANLYAQHNILGPVNWATAIGAGVTQGYAATNCGNLGTVLDPTGEQALLDPNVSSGLAMLTGQAGFQNLAAGNQMSIWGPSSATVSAVADSAGGSDATEVTITSAGGGIGHGTTTPVSNQMPVWVDFELKAGSSSPLAKINLTVSEFSGAPNLYYRVVPVPSAGWQRYRAKFLPLAAIGGGIAITFSSPSLTGKIDIGRVYVYQSLYPVIGNEMLGETSLQGSLTVTPNNDAATGQISASSFLGIGPHFTTSGCSIDPALILGGSTVGSFVSGVAGTCTVTVTMGPNPAGRSAATALHAWECTVHNRTTPANVMTETASTSTTVTISGTTALGDVIPIACTGY